MTAPTIRESLAEASGRLAEVGIAGAARDARYLMAAATGIPRDRIGLNETTQMSGGQQELFERFVSERLVGRPVSQIVGKRLFWGREFRVSGEVLDPRPETEILVAAALEQSGVGTVLDLGTGSGVILLTLLAEWPGARGTGVDISPEALAVATDNALALKVGDRCELMLSDWFRNVGREYDLIVSNPPYIPAADVRGLSSEVRDWEPEIALTPGPCGLEAYQIIARNIGSYLRPGGRALFEIGHKQDGPVVALFEAAGFRNVRVHEDFDGRKRVVELNKPG